jgi:hypothetical protein
VLLLVLAILTPLAAGFGGDHPLGEEVSGVESWPAGSTSIPDCRTRLSKWCSTPGRGKRNRRGIVRHGTLPWTGRRMPSPAIGFLNCNGLTIPCSSSREWTSGSEDRSDGTSCGRRSQSKSDPAAKSRALWHAIERSKHPKMRPRKGRRSPHKGPRARPDSRRAWVCPPEVPGESSQPGRMWIRSINGYFSLYGRQGRLYLPVSSCLQCAKVLLYSSGV